ncbi:hypothetical protein ACWGR4_45370 [Embleya sp. NPDC055664]
MAITTLGIDAEDVDTRSGSRPVCRPSSHWVVTGTFASAAASRASASRSRMTLLDVPMSRHGMGP